MKVKSYSGAVDSGLFLILPAEESPDSLLPQEVRRRVGAIQFVKEFDLNLGQPLIGLDVARALEDIRSKGYAIVKTVVSLEERAP